MSNELGVIDTGEGSIVAPFISEYIRGCLPQADGKLSEMETDALERHIPIIQPEVAQWIRVFMKTRSFSNALEIGTAIGYSTAIIAGELACDGRLDTVEIREDHFFTAQKNLADLKLTSSVVQHLGDAAQVIPTLTGPFDLVFMDGAKGQYRKFLELVEPKLKVGAVVISDNVFFRGMIANPTLVKRRKRTIVTRMKSFMEYMMKDGPYDTALLPLGDGMAVSVYRGQSDKYPRVD